MEILFGDFAELHQDTARVLSWATAVIVICATAGQVIHGINGLQSSHHAQWGDDHPLILNVLVASPCSFTWIWREALKSGNHGKKRAGKQITWNKRQEWDIHNPYPNFENHWCGFNWQTSLIHVDPSWMKQGAMMLPSGKRLHSYGKIHPFLMGKSTISMVIFNSYVTNYQRV